MNQSEQIGSRQIAAFAAALAARSPTPGGGAAAAVAAAIGAAAGAMALRYTTGKRWADRADAMAAAADRLDALRLRMLADADADEAAYAAWSAANASGSVPPELTAASAAIPLGLLHACVDAAEELARAAPRCNPQLVSDVRTGLHLLAGAGRAAHATWLANHPDAAAQAAAAPLLERLATAERTA